MEHTVKEIEKRGTAGGYTVYKLVKSLTNKPKPQPANLTTDPDGNLLKSPEEMTKVWEDFLRPKVTATSVETKRLIWDTLHSTIVPPSDPTDLISKEDLEFETAMESMKNNKTTGPDGVPIEVFKGG